MEITVKSHESGFSIDKQKLKKLRPQLGDAFRTYYIEKRQARIYLHNNANLGLCLDIIKSEGFDIINIEKDKEKYKKRAPFLV